jgi:hypothetical protein
MVYIGGWLIISGYSGIHMLVYIKVRLLIIVVAKARSAKTNLMYSYTGLLDNPK